MSDSVEDSRTPISVTPLDLSMNPESAVSRNYSSGSTFESVSSSLNL